MSGISNLTFGWDATQLGTKELVGYYASWEDWNPGQNALGNLPNYVTTGAPASSLHMQRIACYGLALRPAFELCMY